MKKCTEIEPKKRYRHVLQIEWAIRLGQLRRRVLYPAVIICFSAFLAFMLWGYTNDTDMKAATNIVLSSRRDLIFDTADMDAIKKRKEISDKSQKAMEDIQDYYDTLKAIAAYPDYLDGLERRFVAYSDKLEAVVKSEEYEKYTYYLEHQEEIEAALEMFDSEKEDTDTESSSSEDDPEDAEKVADMADLYDKYKDFDVDEYLDDLEIELLVY